MQNRKDIQNKYYIFIKELNDLKESISNLNGVRNKQLADIQTCFINALENEINSASEEMKNAIVEGINSATADPGATTTISTTTNAIGVGSIFTSILFIIVLFFLTKYLMKHKINVK